MDVAARMVALGILVAALGLPPVPAAGQDANPMFAALANEKWAARTAEHARVLAELAFLEGVLASDRRSVALLLLDSEDIRDCLVEKAEAEAADAELAAVYLDKHPLRVGSVARIAAATQAIDHFVESELRGRQALAEVLEAERAALRGALEARGGAADPAARTQALMRLQAEMDVDRIEHEAAAGRYRAMLEQGDTAGLLGSMPEQATFLARRTSRRLNNPRTEDERYGENHPTRVQQKEFRELLETTLRQQLETAIAAQEAQVELDAAVREALAAALEAG